MSKQTKSLILAAGLVLVLSGLLIALGYLCIVPLAIPSSPREALGIGTVSFALLMLTLGAGGVVAWHSIQSLRGKPSRALRLPQA